MKVIRNAIVTDKFMPKSVWIAAFILPGGLAAVGLWLAGKGMYQSIKDRNKNDRS